MKLVNILTFLHFFPRKHILIVSAAPVASFYPDEFKQASYHGFDGNA